MDVLSITDNGNNIFKIWGTDMIKVKRLFSYSHRIATLLLILLAAMIFSPNSTNAQLNTCASHGGYAEACNADPECHYCPVEGTNSCKPIEEACIECTDLTEDYCESGVGCSWCRNKNICLSDEVSCTCGDGFLQDDEICDSGRDCLEDCTCPDGMVPNGLSGCMVVGDQCPYDPDKTEPGVCGCGTADTDTDGDGTPDCNDDCPNDADKTDPGVCGCGVIDVDSDGDGTYNCKESPAIVTTAVSGDTTETGTTATFSVKLKSPPDDDVVLTVSSGDTTEGNVSPASLTFTSDNWNAYQTVTVVGVDDDVADDDQTFNVQLDVDDDNTDDTTGYTDLSQVTVAVTNVDDETAGFTIGAVSDDTTESGGTATFTVTLASEPTDDVTITVSSSDTTEGTVSPSSLTFTSANWNVTSHVVTVTGADDDIADGDQTYTIVLGAATSDDANYDGLDPADVAIVNTDNDSPGISVSAVSGDTSEAGDTAEFTIVLFTQPEADVTFTLESSNPLEGTVSPEYVIFTPDDWNVAQTVTVTGIDDDVVDGDQEYTIELGVAASDDADYDGLDPDDVTVINTGDDTASTGSGGGSDSGGSGGCFIGTLMD